MIKSFSTEQFAGISDRQISFSDGMNVVLGDNEAGKSTMIAAMYAVLNKSVKIDRRVDRDFLTEAFPASGEDTADARVILSVDGEEYRIEKVWDRINDVSEVKFKPKSKGLLRGTQAEKAIKELVQYGPAVYSNLIFGRQSHEEEILAWCYDFFSAKPDQDAAQVKRTITEAVSAAGGISPDKLAQMIGLAIYGGGTGKQKVKGLIGNWNYENDEPERDARGNIKVWQKGNGSIIEAFYEYEAAKQQMDTATKIDDQITEKTERLTTLMAEKVEWEEKREALVSQQSAVSARENVERLWKKVQKEREDAAKAIQDWPAQEVLLQKLYKLQCEKEEKEKRAQKKKIVERMKVVNRLRQENEIRKKEVDKYPEIDTDYGRVQRAESSLAQIHGRLTSSKLRAAVALENGYQMSVTMADGTTKEVTASETVDADGFLTMYIPGVASIQVAPQDLDVAGLQKEETETQEEIDHILVRYEVESVEELSELVRERKEKISEWQEVEREIHSLLSDRTLEEYQQEAEQIVTDENIVIAETLEEDIRRVLLETGRNSLDAAIGFLEKSIEDYTAMYSDREQLSLQCQELGQQVFAYEQQLQQYSDGTTMTESEYTVRLNEIKGRIRDLEREIGEIRTDIGTLSAEEVTDLSGLETLVEEKRQEWLREKKKYEYYLRIQKDFKELHSETEGEFNRFYDKFDQYLTVITGGQVSLQRDSSGLCLKSRSFNVNARELLSAGTKKTVMLAFRLAVLEYFYPDGDGLVVLDDDLLDMDPDRREQAAKILNQFARSNQVIFTTCDPAIAELLGGNLIRV